MNLLGARKTASAIINNSIQKKRQPSMSDDAKVIAKLSESIRRN